MHINVTRYGAYVVVDIKANAFVHHMVRNIVGSLMEVGAGNQPESWMAELLAAKDVFCCQQFCHPALRLVSGPDLHQAAYNIPDHMMYKGIRFDIHHHIRAVAGNVNMHHVAPRGTRLALYRANVCSAPRSVCWERMTLPRFARYSASRVPRGAT